MKKESFEWDDFKNRENLQKHGVSFEQAQEVFKDPKAMVIKDTVHSSKEERWFCTGYIKTGIVTVRFIYRENKIRIFGAGYWRKLRKKYLQKETSIMKTSKEIPSRFPGETAIYEEDPFELGEINHSQLVEVSKDFLPNPHELIFKNSLKKVVLSIDHKSEELFRNEAKRRNQRYPNIIKTLLVDFLRHRSKNS